MARRRESAKRSSRRCSQLAVEGLEVRQLLAANVAVASEAGPSSSPLVRLVDAETGVERASVLAFEAGFKGGVRVALGRVTGNAAPDVVVGSGSGRVAEVRVFKPVTSGATTTLQQVHSFQPFGPSYRGGIEVVVGDVDGDTVEDIIVSKSREGGDVKVFRMTNPGGTLTRTEYATIAKPFGPRYNGGSSVGVADVGEFTNGALVKSVADNRVEILVGSGSGLPAQVRVYDISRPNAPRLADTIAPFGPLFKGGVSVTSGRYSASAVADSIDDIVVMAGRGGASQTRVFDGTVGAAANTLLRTFSPFANQARPNAAVFMAAVDADGNGQVDRFLATQGDPGGPAGIANVSVAGVRAASPVTTLAGPLRIAAARTVFQPQTLSVATRIATTAVPTLGTQRPMQYRDIVTGSGAVASPGNTLTVQYTGMLTNGSVFDTSRQTGRTPFQFTLDGGQVIAGWDAGLAGMQVGGRRLLVIPPELAYGDTARPANPGFSGIPAGSTLVFDVELVSVSGNATASITGTATGAVTENSGTTTTGGTLTVVDPDAGQAVFAAVSGLSKTYGTFTFDPATGVWGYTLDNARAATQALTAGQTVTDSLTVTSADGTASRTIVVTVTGAGDSATITGTTTGALTEDGATTTVGGTLTATDPDAGQSSFATPGSLAGTYGTFTFDAVTGVWGYTLDNARAVTQALTAGQTVTDTLVVTSIDGSASVTIEVTITGANESATITGTATAALTEDGVTTTAGGTLTVTDADAGQAVFATPGSLAGTYGTFTFDPATGVWGYAIDNARSVTQELAAGQTVTDTLVVTSIDGTASVTIEVTITGAADGASITGTDTGAVTEDGATTTAGGTLTVVDADAGQSSFATPGSLAGTYGTFTFDPATGVWGYTLDNTRSATQALTDGQTVTDTLVVTSTDGAASATVTVTVTGAGDAATIDGPDTGAVATEGTTTAGGTLTVVDADAGQASFATPASLAGTYGTFTFDPATGAWTYALDTTRYVTWVLTAGAPRTDTLVVTSIDGTASQDVTVTVTGYAMQTLSVVVPTPSPSAAVEAGSTSTLEYRDITVGTGTLAEPGQLLTVHYIGFLAGGPNDGDVFDSSLLPGRSPFQFTLGAREVIAGWDAGVEGMRVGGLRVLVIPPELAYGDADRGTIPPGSTLSFLVELVAVDT